MSFTIVYLILGDFFLNDLIEAEDDENKCLVADVSKNTKFSSERGWVGGGGSTVIMLLFKIGPLYHYSLMCGTYILTGKWHCCWLYEYQYKCQCTSIE